jgi:hypothetical protein
MENDKKKGLMKAFPQTKKTPIKMIFELSVQNVPTC